MNTDRRVAWTLLALRISIFLVMLMWTLDKFLRPDHVTAVYAHFYTISGLTASTSYALGVTELALLAGFVVGLWRRFTYGTVLVLHGISTISCYY